MVSLRHLEFTKFLPFVKRLAWKLKSTSAYQIWSKSDHSRLGYGDIAIFKMAAVRHLELAKIALLVTKPISACDPSLLFQTSLRSANMAPRYRPKNDVQYGVRPPSWICYHVIILHPKNAFYVPNFVLASGLYNSLYYRWSRDIHIYHNWTIR